MSNRVPTIDHVDTAKKVPYRGNENRSPAEQSMLRRKAHPEEGWRIPKPSLPISELEEPPVNDFSRNECRKERHEERHHKKQILPD